MSTPIMMKNDRPLARALREIFGSVEAVIHGGHIIRIERKETLQFERTGEFFE